MKALLQFLLEASSCICLLYGLYIWLFAKTTHFTWNRVFLLGMLIISCVLPLVSIPTLWPSSSSFFDGEKIMVTLEEVIVFQKGASSSIPKLDLILLVLSVYVGGVIFGLFRFGASLYGMLSMIRKAEKHWVEGHRVLIHPDFKPSSFLHFVFLPGYTYNDRPSALILAHEQSHVKKYHSLDLLFLEVFRIFFWFHPLLHFIHESLKETHEFQVDREMLHHSDLKEYGHLLIDPYPMASGPAYIHYFNQLQIKKRIMMMTKSSSAKSVRLRYALVLPCIALLALVFSCEMEEDLNIQGTDEVLALSSTPTKAEVFDVVEEMPTPKGGMEGWNRYLNDNLVYPTSAKEEGIEGTVYAEFVVDKSGKVRDVSVVRGIDRHLDAEALNVLRNSPDWTPGKQQGQPVDVKMRIPIRFRINPS
ncbi:M56 family metallopeptidase [Negadavirga shengliensis]|uniref:TonB family protein n=1 Tax=Negadavirga shengliensis TaxID=1389218 RepID=A0ABV9SW26_9BACT